MFYYAKYFILIIHSIHRKNNIVPIDKKRGYMFSRSQIVTSNKA